MNLIKSVTIFMVGTGIALADVPPLGTVFTTIYANTSGHQIGEAEKKGIKDQGSGDTYGEMTAEGIAQFVNYINQKFPYLRLSVTGKRKFLDLGSGTGKVTLGVAMLTDFEDVNGIEISPTRYETSIQALSALEEKYPDAIKKGRVKFTKNDALKENLKDVKLMWISSLCFPKEFMEKLGAKLSKELQKGAVVVTSQAFPDMPNSRLKLVEKITLNMTWTEKSETHVYQVA